MSETSVICIGNLDGVHQGHLALLYTARVLAMARKAALVVITFDPHPTATLDPANQPPRLCPPDQKLQRLREAGVDQIITLKPTPDVLNQDPRQFIEKLVRDHHPVAFVEGADFRFGKGRAGDIDMLRELGNQHGFEVIIQPSVEGTLSDLSIVTVRSSVIRWLLGHGRVKDAASCLGRPFTLTSTVVQGEQRGRTIGIPTANLDLETLNDHMLPADGVYAGYAILSGDDRRHTAAISVGNKPSFGKVQLTIEAHLLDFAGDLYGQTLTLAFTHWIRDQIRFPTLDTLREQLTRDIDRVRQCEGSPIPCT
jgi:riboflavin kinase/FMN adenylyltransferase